VRAVFLRIWVGATVLFVAGLLAYEVVQWTLFSDQEVEWYESMVRGGYVRGAQDVVGAADREATLEALSTEFALPVRVLAAAEFDAPNQARLAVDQVVAARHEWIDVYLVLLPGDRGEVVVYGPTGYPTPWLLPRFLLVLALSSGFAALAWFGLRPVLRSQAALESTAQRIAAGDLAARIPQGAGVATPDVAGAFDTMAERIEDLVTSQQEVLRAASHELRTPIARLRIGVHLLASAAADERDEREAKLDDDLQELDDLVDEVLLHARLGPDGAGQEPVDVELAPLVDGLLARLSADTTVEVGDVEVTLRAAPRLLRRALRNLILNASRYADTVRISTDGDPLAICVDDDGPGIPEAQRERALLPFVRFGEQGGHGLGLAIVARIVRWHGGTITLGTSDLGGLRVRLVWPQP